MFYKLKAWFGRAAMFALISIPQLILAGTLFVPLAYIGFPWWANALIFLFTLIFDKLGAVVYIVVWVWSFVIFLRSPLTYFSIVYLVFLVLYVAISFILPHTKHRK